MNFCGGLTCLRVCGNANQMHWTTVCRKRRASSSAHSPTRSLQAVDTPIHLFLSRLVYDTPVQSVIAYVQETFQDAKNIRCVPLKTKYNLYASFKITMVGISISEATDPCKWPKKVLIKKFLSHNSRASHDARASTNFSSNSNGRQ